MPRLLEQKDENTAVPSIRNFVQLPVWLSRRVNGQASPRTAKRTKKQAAGLADRHHIRHARKS